MFVPVGIGSYWDGLFLLSVYRNRARCVLTLSDTFFLFFPLVIDISSLNPCSLDQDETVWLVFFFFFQHWISFLRLKILLDTLVSRIEPVELNIQIRLQYYTI